MAQTQVNLLFVIARAGGSAFDRHISAIEVRRLPPTWSITMGPVKQAMSDAKMSPNDIDEVILAAVHPIPQSRPWCAVYLRQDLI